MMNHTISRRAASKATLLAGISAATTAQLSQAAPKLKKNATILFQGDSITDAGRDRKRQTANDARSLGRGYPAHIAGDLLAESPKLDLRIHNRGISGNKVPDLDKRWQVDCIDIKPDILSILIGVNDIWHKLNGRYDGTPEVYRDGFDALLERTKKSLPDVTIAICEPFVLRCGAVNDSWFPEFETRRAFAEEVAKKHNAIWVPFQAKFDEAVSSGTAPEYWAADGVHPSHAGHSLMAKVWRESVGI